MLYIRDPYTDEMRDQLEYHCRGEAHVARPVKPEDVTDIEWADYLFFFTNAKGIHFERWVNTSGHRKWFNAIRNTVTDEFLATYRPDEDVVKIIKELNINIKDIKSPHVLAKLGVKKNIANEKVAEQSTAKKLAKKLAKATAKKPAKATAKKPAKATAKKPAKATAKTAAKATAKKPAKATAKTAAKATAKKPAKATAKTAAKATAKKLAKATAKKLAKATAKKPAKKTV